MYLAIVRFCASVTDSQTCNILVRKNHLFKSVEACQEETLPVAKYYKYMGYHVKTQCLEFNPFGELI